MRSPSASRIVPTPSMLGAAARTPSTAATWSTIESSMRSRWRSSSEPISALLRTTTSMPALASLNAWAKPARMVSPSTSVAARKATPRMTAVQVPIRRRLRAQRPFSVTLNMVSDLPNCFMRSRMRSGDGAAIESTMRPSSRNSTVSAVLAATGSWVTMTMVWANSSTARRMKARISLPLRVSRLPVGSSAKISSGLEARARATATRCCWPPDSSLGRCFRRSPRPTVSTTVRTHCLSGLVPASDIGRVMFSSASSVGSRLYAWKTKPTRSRRTRVRSRSESEPSSTSPM